MMKRVLVAGGLAASLLLPAPAAFSQSTGAVRGKIVDEKGQPKPVNIRLGLSDGSYTELRAGDLADGAQVIIGMAAAGNDRPKAASLRFGF